MTLDMQSLFSVLLLDPRYRQARYRAALGSYAMVLLLGLIPGARTEVGMFLPGLVLHASTYAALAVLLFTGSEGSASQCAAKTIVTIMAMGALDEFIQGFVSYRTAAVGDWLVDCVAGALISLALYTYFSLRDRAREAKR